MELASLETREKLITQAEDILDRDGWITGELADVICFYEEGVESIRVRGYCAIGALRQAMMEQGVLPDEWRRTQTHDVYHQVSEVMGWPYAFQTTVYNTNDFTGRRAAFNVVRDKLETQKKTEK